MTPRDLFKLTLTAAIDNWRLLLLGALVLMIGVQHEIIQSKKRALERMDAVVATERAERAKCKTSRDELEAALKAQGAAIQANADRARQKIEEAQAAAADAAKGRKAMEARVAKLLAPHPSTGDACKDVLEAVK